jgi:hypothetical protein
VTTNNPEFEFTGDVRQTEDAAYPGPDVLPSNIRGYYTVKKDLHEELQINAIDHLEYCQPQQMPPAAQPGAYPPPSQGAWQGAYPPQPGTAPAPESNHYYVEPGEPRRHVKHPVLLGIGAALVVALVAGGVGYDLSKPDSHTAPAATGKTNEQADHVGQAGQKNPDGSATVAATASAEPSQLPSASASAQPAFASPSSFKYRAPGCEPVATFELNASLPAKLVGRIFADNKPYTYPVPVQTAPSPSPASSVTVEACVNDKSAVTMQAGILHLDRAKVYYIENIDNVVLGLTHFSKKDATHALKQNVDPLAGKRDGKLMRYNNGLVNNQENHWLVDAMNIMIARHLSQTAVAQLFTAAGETALLAQATQQAADENIDTTQISTAISGKYDATATYLAANLHKPKIDPDIVRISYNKAQFNSLLVQAAGGTQ